VDLARVEAASLLVHRVAARHLLPLDDPGDALHVADDEDLHAIDPTTSPRLSRTGTVVNDSTPSIAATAGRRPRVFPSSTLNVHPTPSGERAQSSPSAPPFAIHPGSARISSVSAEPSPPTSSGRARIASAIRGGVRAKTSAMRESGMAKVG